MKHSDTEQESKFFPTACHWGAYRAEVRGGLVVALHPVAGDPDPSPLGRSVPGALHDSLRISRPMARLGWLKHGPKLSANARGSEHFVELSWDDALSIVAAELERVKATHGNAAIFAGSYGWASAGRFHHAQSQLRRFFNMFGGHAFSMNTYSTAAAEVIVPHVIAPWRAFRGQIPTWDVIARHTKLVVAFGGLALKNSQIDAGGMGRHIAREGQLACKAQGVSFVSLSAIRDDMADFLEAEWLTPRPNTDVAVMLGLIHTLVIEGLHDKDFLSNCCVGWGRFEPYLLGAIDGLPKNAEWAARISGIPAETLRDLARRMKQHRTLVTISWSLQRADHGEQTYWAAIALAAALGQIGLPGGGIGFGYGAIHGIGAACARIAPPSVPCEPNPVKAFIPVARITDMLENPGGTFDYNGRRHTYPDARIVYWVGGNPFHHHQDLTRLVRAWQRPETVVVHDSWWNPMARHADIVLPASTTLERNDLTGTSIDRFILAMHKAAEPFGESRSDYEIFSGLAARLGFERRFTEGRTEREWLEWFYAVWQERAHAADTALPDFATFWRKGQVELPDRSNGEIFLANFRRDPIAHKLETPSGKIEIFSDTIASFAYDDCPGHPTWLEPAEWLGGAKAKTYPLHLISNQPRTRLHSQYDNGAYSRASKVQGREPVWIHPSDAKLRGIRDGDVVRLFNDRGGCLAGAVLTDNVMPGVVQLATGAWYSPAERVGIDDSPMCVHGNPNVLTLDKGTSKLAQGCAALTCLIQVEKFNGAIPEVKAFKPPVTLERSSLEGINHVKLPSSMIAGSLP